MKFPRKYRALLEIGKSDVPEPHHVWLGYAVCALTQESCGWGGWVIDAVFSSAREEPPEGLLPADYEHHCPRCGRQLVVTAAMCRLDLSDNQFPRLQEGIDYEVGDPLQYDDD